MSTRARAWDEAVRSFGLDPAPRTRPGPLRWAGYAVRGSLPDRYRLWVLYDATCSTWVLRHLGRLLSFSVLPIAGVVLLLPGPLHVRVLTAVVACLGGFLFAGLWVNESTDHRLLRAGWPIGAGSELRKRRSEIAAWMATVRKM